MTCSVDWRGHPLYRVKTAETNFSLGSISDEDAAKLKPLTKATTGTWSVHAYDANDCSIGASVGDRSFTVRDALSLNSPEFRLLRWIAEFRRIQRRLMANRNSRALDCER